jgi:hypothetical protein
MRIYSLIVALCFLCLACAAGDFPDEKTDVGVAPVDVAADTGENQVEDSGDKAPEEDSGAEEDSGGETPPTDEGASTEDSGESAQADTSPPVQKLGEAIVLDLESFEVQPGKERQVCKIINLPSDTDIDVVRLESSMTGTSHHFILYEMTDSKALEPVSENQALLEDCEPAHEQLAGNAAYIFGAAAPERTLILPPGVSFHFRAGTRMIIEHHVLNYTPDVISGNVSVRLYPSAEPEKIEHHASIVWFANWGFYLPPNKKTTSKAHCAVPYDVEVFGLTSHFHELGDYFKIEKWVPDGDATFVYEDDDWAHPKYQEYWPTISLKKGEGLQWTCTWDNYKTKAVGPGKYSTDEMCITFAAVYPTNSLSAPNIQCNTPFDIF